ncbi:Mycolipanoate synthase [Lecanicillium sp. MT-2017a]|nr:Mycolipanoate synthase [Lecanicillium sp. MT-2017a]
MGDGNQNSEALEGIPSNTTARSESCGELPHAIDSSPNVRDVPVAICGMGMRLPGGIRNDEDLFEFLVNKKHARSLVPEDRYNSASYASEVKKTGKLASEYGYFLDNVNLKNVDVSMFSMTEVEARALDPIQRLLLEVVREAFESAGEANFRGASIGTYAATYSEDWQSLKNVDLYGLNHYHVTGYQDFMMANRIAWEYDLRGPSMTIKTACSSSGVALHQALQAIRQGEADGAIVTGASIFLDPRLSIYMSSAMTLSPDGFCKTFDAGADGFGRAEGVSCVFIKRLDRAVADGNPIRAVIRASSSNSDGRGPAKAVPNPVVHEALIRRAYRTAGLKCSDTAMVECHGTGTAAGDPKEVEAIAKCFGENGVYLGSVKSNLGHSEGAAFLTGLFKAVVSLERQMILPNIHFENPNPAIPWEEARLKVAVEPTPWPADRKEQISVNGFGIGGSNVHVLLESARTHGIVFPSAANSKADETRLLLLSAGSPQSLKVLIDDYREYLERYPDRLDGVMLNLASRREWLKHRTACLADASGTYRPIAPLSPKMKDKNGVAFIFTGQGAHWVHMGRELLKSQPVFKSTIREIDGILAHLPYAAPWRVEDTLLTCEDVDFLGRPQVAQPVCTALQVALVKLFAAWGVRPVAAIGHSGGEIAAAFAAEALSLRDAVVVAFYRGYVCEKLEKEGAMAAVAQSVKDAERYLKPGTVVACENSPNSVTLSGDVAPLDEVLAAISRDHPDLFVRKLPVKQGYHSHHMQRAGGVYRDLLAEHIQPQSPQIPFFSSVYSRLVSEAADFGPKYWKDNLENPVLFYKSTELLLENCPEVSIHLEIGPHSALGSPLRQTYAEKKSSVLYVSALSRDKNDNDTFLEAVAQLYCAGAAVTLPGSEHTTAPALTDLPRYPWNYDKEYWEEDRLAAVWRFREHPAHDLLGLRVPQSSSVEPSWRNLLRVVDVLWLRDHCICGNIVLPAAAYVAMAGEAAGQLVSNVVGSSANKSTRGGNLVCERGYTVRNLQLKNAMLLDDDGFTEVITTLRPKQLNIGLDSSWYEFSITSFNGSTWITHCKGLVVLGDAAAAFFDEQPTIPAFTKKVSTSRWYKSLRELGYEFGPRFGALRNITTSALERKAATQVIDYTEPGESAYPVHPATLDAFFQSSSIAHTQGNYRKITELAMPVFMAEVLVGPAASQTIDCFADVSAEKAERYQCYGVANGKTVLRLSGLRTQRLSNEAQNARSHLTNQLLQWKPAVEFADLSSLMVRQYDMERVLKLCERLYVLCASELSPTLDQLSPCQPHFGQYIAWLKSQLHRFQDATYPLVADAAEILTMSSASRRAAIVDCLQEAQGADMQRMGTALWRCFSSMADIVEGRVDFLEFIIKDDFLEGVYDSLSRVVDLGGLFSLMGSSQPAQRILEIGAGTGSLTAKALQYLKSDFNERLYSTYTYTDISPGFFVKAQARFTDYEAIEYKVLDISKDPIEQGFDEASYDLIIASNVLHATPSLLDSLQNCRKLLCPSGRLFLQELSPVAKHANFIMGLFPGWWLGEADGRPNEPYVSPERWESLLREAGFQGISAMQLDGDAPYHMNASMIAELAQKQHTTGLAVTIFSWTNSPSHLAKAAADILESQGHKVRHSAWRSSEVILKCDAIISFLDVEDGAKPMLKEMTSDDLDYLLGILRERPDQTILWLSRSAQVGCSDPHQGQILGLARAIRTELATPFATMELDSIGDGAPQAICDLLGSIAEKRPVDSDIDPDMEFAWVDNKIHTSKLHWISNRESLANSIPSDGPLRLAIEKPGLLQTLQWRTVTPSPSLKPTEVRLRMATFGMNFRDLMVTLGTIPGDEMFADGSTAVPGAEGVGSVTDTGSEIRDLSVGSRVAVFAPGLSTEVVVDEEQCVRISDELTDEEAATMIVVYITALWCLTRRTNLKKGQTVLIHSAAGGVGIAAIHVARWIGADIFATTSNEEKVELLTSEFGIPRDRIFHSRDESFYGEVIRATGGVGVDVVLSALTGELLHASWRCVAPHGIMIDIGKRDVLGHGQLDMAQFARNCTFTCFDGYHLFQEQAKGMATPKELMLEIFALRDAGHIQPIQPISVFESTEVEDAFRYMQQGLHVGKIVIRVDENDGNALEPTSTAPLPSFRQDASYLLVGGMGGLGKSIASWMVEHGAKSIIFLSRSAGQSEEDQALTMELEEAGCKVHCCIGDVSDTDSVARAVAGAPLPIAGVMQMAMVLQDVATLDMNMELWTAVNKPKVDGTWNLHNLLPDPLDFFILFSSIGGIFGYPGQANYASTSSFQDAFVQYRHSLGKVASVIDVGPIDDVGHVATTSVIGKLSASSFLITEQELLDTVQLAMASLPGAKDKLLNRQQLIQLPWMTLPIMDAANPTLWKRDPRIAHYRNLESAPREGLADEESKQIRQYIQTLATDPRRFDDEETLQYLAEVIRKRVATFVMKEPGELDMLMDLAAVGVDSLVAIELRNWWAQSLGVNVSMLELVQEKDFYSLAKLAIEKLKERYVK